MGRAKRAGRGGLVGRKDARAESAGLLKHLGIIEDFGPEGPAAAAGWAHRVDTTTCGLPRFQKDALARLLFQEVLAVRRDVTRAESWLREAQVCGDPGYVPVGDADVAFRSCAAVSRTLALEAEGSVGGSCCHNRGV